MNLFVIDGTRKTIEQIDGDADEARLRALIGFDAIDFDELNDQGDRLYFDESCFIRQTPGVGRFQYRRLAPIAGVGVIVGHAGGRFAAPTLTETLATPDVVAIGISTDAMIRAPSVFRPSVVSASVHRL